MIVAAVNREELILSHLHIAAEVAGYARFDHLRKRLGFDELQSAASEGVVMAADGYEPERAEHGFEPYARRAAVSRIIDLARRNRRFPLTMDVEHAEDTAPASVNSEELLSALADSERELVEAHYFEGQSIRALAIRFGVCRNTIASRLGEALRRMRIAGGG